MAESGFWSSIFGSAAPSAAPEEPKSTMVDVPPIPVGWPDRESLDMARIHDADYGSPSAPTARVMRPELASVQSFRRTGNLPPTQQADQDYRDKMDQIWLAANRNPVAALGLDFRHSISTPDTGEKYTLAGFYRPSNDMMWWAERDPSSVVHESIHRGIQKLRAAGMLPKFLTEFLPPDEETLVRGMMLRHFGDIEIEPGAKAGNDQVQYAKQLMDRESPQGRRYRAAFDNYFDNHLDQLNNAAAQYFAKNRPRGPRAAGGRAKDKAVSRALSIAWLARRKRPAR